MSEDQKINKKHKPIRKTSLFSIGAKLVSIVTLIVLVSLGSITALVSWLVRQDLQIAAEDNNFEANRRSAAEAEDVLVKMSADALMLTRMLVSVGTKGSLARETADFFFEQNPRIAALFFTVPNQGDVLLLNNRFFLAQDIEESLAGSFVDKHRIALRRASMGETVILNATPHFTAHLLAMFFPGRVGHGAGQVNGGMVLFNPENLNNLFISGINQSWMINNSGDILIHADYEMIRNNVNVADRDFIRQIQESPHRNSQALFKTGFGISGTVYIMNQNFLLKAWEKIRQAALFLSEKAKQYVWPIIDKGIDAIYKYFFIDRKAPAKTQEGEESNVLQFIAYNKLTQSGCIVITSVEYNKVFEGIEATTRRNIYLTGAVLLFSIMLIWFFAKSISIPLKVLAAAAHSIEGGEFDLNLTPPKGRDEIGILTKSFQKMCAALQIFGRFTNREIALGAMRGQIKPGGTPKNATIFFSDIRGFTAASENFTTVFGVEASNRIVHWLNEYFTQMIDCVEKTGGTIDKFIGDAVMAHWGTAYTTGSPEKDAFNCVHSALMMRKALFQMNKNRKNSDYGNPPIRIGCGINTGIVTAGQLGSDMRMEYTVIGDPVNLASRIEALTKPLGVDILISEDTWRNVRTNFITEEMPSVTVKGKSKPLRIFAVVNYANIEKGPKTLAEVRELLNIEAPDMDTVDVNADEKKYKIGDKKK